jgi:hypothetical protein
MGSCSEKPEANEKIIGVLGHSYNTGVRGQSLGIKENGMNLGSGVEGHGRDCPGGRFFSRHDYALIAGSKSMEDGNPSSGKALLVEGDSKFNGKILLKSNNPFTENVLAYKIKADFEEPLSPGDLVSIHNEKSLTVRKSNQAYDTNVMGVVVLQPAIEISAETEIGGAQIAILGIVKAKVDPSFGEIKPGDLLTTSKTPGHAMKANITDLKQTGSIIGKALEAAKSNTKEIKILLTRF